jgi:PST family polysaccharide transporter
LAVFLGEAGIAKIGQLRNLVQIITSTSSLGIFNGVIKYVSEYNANSSKLKELFSTTFVFVFLGASITSITLFFTAPLLSQQLFGSPAYANIIKVLATLPVIIGVNRVLHGIINGLSKYKTYAKIELLTYLLSTVLLLICLYNGQLKGVLFAIVLSPLIQLCVICFIFGRYIKQYVQLKALRFKAPFAKQLLAFSLMSFFSTVILNYVELDIRTVISNRIGIDEAGYWTAMNFISKNYMVFSSSLFTLYVIPKFAKIYTITGFKQEVLNIYKTIMPLFGMGMILIYLFRNFIINIIYPNFHGIEPLFKWQLLGDFIRLASLVMAHQFLAKRLYKSFIITEVVSLTLFYLLARVLVDLYGTEGIVMAHFYRYIIYFLLVIYVIKVNFSMSKNN